jgi:hypothetical protein
VFKSLWDKIKSQWAVSVLLGLMVLVAILGIVLVAWPDGLIKQALWQPILVLLGLLALAIILVILWKVPQLQTPSELTEPAARANFENEAHRTTAQIVLGAVVLAGVYFTWQQVIAAQQQCWYLKSNRLPNGSHGPLNNWETKIALQYVWVESMLWSGLPGIPQIKTTGR